MFPHEKITPEVSVPDDSRYEPDGIELVWRTFLRNFNDKIHHRFCGAAILLAIIIFVHQAEVLSFKTNGSNLDAIIIGEASASNPSGGSLSEETPSGTMTGGSVPEGEGGGNFTKTPAQPDMETPEVNNIAPAGMGNRTDMPAGEDKTSEAPSGQDEAGEDKASEAPAGQDEAGEDNVTKDAAEEEGASLAPAGEESLLCDRYFWRTDVCDVRGDVRVDGRRNLVMLYARRQGTARGVETVKPYTRKWEADLMNRIADVVIASVDAPPGLQPWVPDPLEPSENLPAWMLRPPDNRHKLVAGNGSDWSESAWKRYRARKLLENITQLGFLEIEREQAGAWLEGRGGRVVNGGNHAWVAFEGGKYVTNETVQEGQLDVLECDVKHSVPGVIFATSGYTGNIYHEFNDGLIPLYITTHDLGGEFVPIIESAHLWWFHSYQKVLRQLSSYPAVLLGRDRFVHCFPRVIVGMRIHDELTVNTSWVTPPASIHGFQGVLDRAWLEAGRADWKGETEKESCMPFITFVSRKRTRVISNEEELVAMMRGMGFHVSVVQPTRDLPLQWMWNHLRSANVFMGVHGAAMTHLLFMKPGSVFIQILPLGTEWAATMYYRNPAVNLGLQYVEYKVDLEESSLVHKYERNDTILMDPDSVHITRGWWVAKDIYLENQNLTLDLGRMHRVMLQVYHMARSSPSFVSDRANLTCPPAGDSL